MPLAPCRSLLGQAKYIREDPRHLYAEDVIFTGNGLFDYRRKMVAGSGEYRGVPVLHLAPGGGQQPLVTGIDPMRVMEEAPDDLYYWGGILKGHYGHFLVNTLARLWMYAQLPKPRPKIVHWWRDMRAMWDLPYVSGVLTQLDLRLDDFVRFEQPTLIHRILVPETSFEENHLVHDVYGRFLRSIGDRLAPKSDRTGASPLYISRSLLPNGTSRITNEDVFEDRLRRAGFEIFHPEHNTLETQIAAFKSRELIAGFIGSGLLNAAFAQHKSIAAVSYNASVYSNQVLTDLAADNRALYCYPHDDIIALEPTSMFQQNFEFVDPVRTAEEFLREIDKFQGDYPQRRAVRPDTLSVEAHGDDPIGENLSRGLVLEHGIEAVFDGGAPAKAMSRQWWRIDLRGLCDLHEVRLHGSEESSQNVSPTISISDDGQDWIEVACPAGATTLGGPHLKAYRWLPDKPYATRHVRVEIFAPSDCGFNLLALEVFGARLREATTSLFP